MSMNERRVRDLIAEQAADWFVENRDGLGPEQRSEFVAWLKASPVHIEEYLALTALTQDLRSACQPAGESIEQLLERARLDQEPTVLFLSPHTPLATRETRSGRWRLIALAASLLVLSVGVLAFERFWPIFRPAVSADETARHLQTRHGEQRTYRLADQSVIHLNTDTSVSVRIDGKKRLVVLEDGEAEFEVTHEQRRPFRVLAGSIQVVDVGTTFNVRVGPAATVVTVAAGRVDVGLTSNVENASPHLQLGAGQQVRIADGVLPAQPAAADVARATAWLHRQIKFENEPLARLTDEFNRYAPVPFEIVTQALRDLKVSGVFATDDSEAFIAFLRSLPAVHVQVTATRIRVSQG
jgi:transmembrane sensor